MASICTRENFRWILGAISSLKSSDALVQAAQRGAGDVAAGDVAAGHGEDGLRLNLGVLEVFSNLNASVTL